MTDPTDSLADEQSDRLDPPRSDPDDRRRVGPFVAGRTTFLVEAVESDVLDSIGSCLRDLLVPDDQLAGSPGDEPAVLLVERNRPSWLPQPWVVYRDGVMCANTITGDAVAPYVLWEMTRVLLDSGPDSVTPVHASAIVRNGQAVLLCGAPHSDKSTLAAWLIHRGWAFLSDDISLLDVSDPGAVEVHAFRRPLAVPRSGVVDAMVDDRDTVPDDEHDEVLIPASRLGLLADAAPLVAVVFPSSSSVAEAGLTPQTPAKALTTAAAQVPELAHDGANAFHALASVVTNVPAYWLRFENLDAAHETLAGLVDGAGTSDPDRATREDEP